MVVVVALGVVVVCFVTNRRFLGLPRFGFAAVLAAASAAFNASRNACCGRSKRHPPVIFRQLIYVSGLRERQHICRFVRLVRL
jgi:hypothetical protein